MTGPPGPAPPGADRRDGLIEGQIVPQGIPEQCGLLSDHGHQAVGAGKGFDWDPVQLDGACAGVIVAQQQVHRSGLAAAAGAFEQVFFALLHRQAEPVQNGLQAVIGEGHLPELDLRAEGIGRGGSAFFRCFPEKRRHILAHGLDGEQLPDDVRQGDQGPGELVDHADGDKEIACGKIPPEDQPAGKYQHDVVGEVGDQRGDELGDSARRLSRPSFSIASKLASRNRVRMRSSTEKFFRISKPESQSVTRVRLSSIARR